MKSFFTFLHDSLKAYKPNIILSADLFGYAAIREGDVGIGQRLEDIGNSFDYISFMLYPSHYYSGFYLTADPTHNFTMINFNASQSRMHPDMVVGRSLHFARDFLAGIQASSTSSTTVQSISVEKSMVRLRPWLEDFFHEADRVYGRPFGVEKVRMQIDAAENTENHGWLLWNASNVYTERALKKE
ncbi:MAG: hypothetical protein HYZ69_04340 [Candidatus Colwellbacteria bacterium]|nr:hypothetical protein [Candidatus Colwellbacteria bacterium]